MSKAKAKTTPKAPPSPSKPLLNLKHEQFCQEYKKDMNANRSYRVAYPNAKKSSEVSSYRLIRKPLVAARAAYLTAKVVDECDVTAKMITDELKKIGFGSIKDIVGLGNSVKDISQLPDNVAAAIESISASKSKNGKTVKVTMHSKLKALDSLGKRIGYFEKHQKQALGSLAQAMKEISGRGDCLDISD